MAMNNQHTPGPWEVDRVGIRPAEAVTTIKAASGHRIAWMSVDSSEGDDDLIAAAPDLLAACIETLSKPQTVEVLEQVAAAIAKARGLTESQK